MGKLVTGIFGAGDGTYFSTFARPRRKDERVERGEIEEALSL